MNGNMEQLLSMLEKLSADEAAEKVRVTPRVSWGSRVSSMSEGRARR